MKTSDARILPVVALLSMTLAGCASNSIETNVTDASSVQKLLDGGADINAKDDSGDTTLHHAVFNGKKDVVELLLEKGADPNARKNNGDTPLMGAAELAEVEIMKLLVAKGADVNARSNNGGTALHVAALRGKKDVVRFLLAHGADPSIRINDGESVAGWARGATARVAAEHQGFVEVASLLKKAEEDGPRRVETAEEDPSERALFEKAAQDYRGASIKPALPEEARKYMVQAEVKVRDKSFDEAAALYAKGLAIAPWWPEGHFNRALVLGENRYYLGAIREMKRYRVLVPDGPASRAAQDKIYAWEAEAGDQ